LKENLMTRSKYLMMAALLSALPMPADDGVLKGTPLVRLAVPETTTEIHARRTADRPWWWLLLQDDNGKRREGPAANRRSADDSNSDQDDDRDDDRDRDGRDDD
jgi:hypothetical protein